MHIPSIFVKENLENILGFIAANPLATMIAQTNNGIEACHIPLFWHNDNSQHGCLYGHFGRANSIYQDALADTSWLVIFHDSGYYISPNWYPSKAKLTKKCPLGTIKVYIFNLR